MKFPHHVCQVIVGLQLVFSAASLGAAVSHWPQFRGPGALGVVDHPNLPDRWGTNENVAWKIEVPAAFVTLHRRKLKYWHAFALFNTENPVADTTSMGAIYHRRLQCGVAVVHNDAGGVYSSLPFEFVSGKVPEQQIVEWLLAHIEAEGVPLCGELTNYVPHLCPRSQLHQAYRAISSELCEDDADYDALFAESYQEEKP